MPKKPVAKAKKDKVKYKVKVFQSTLDPNRHAEAIADIRESHRQQALAAEEEEEEAEEEMGSEEDEEAFSLSENESGYIVGRIDLSFPENIEEYENSPLCYPPSYYTLSPKERLLLMYAENFRKQFVINNQGHRPLVLALPNECNVQVGLVDSIIRIGIWY